MILLTVLVDRIVTPDEIRRANEICQNANSELAWFEINAFDIVVTCASSAEFTIKIDDSIVPGSKIQPKENFKEVEK